MSLPSTSLAEHLTGSLVALHPLNPCRYYTQRTSKVEGTQATKGRGRKGRNLPSRKVLEDNSRPFTLVPVRLSF